MCDTWDVWHLVEFRAQITTWLSLKSWRLFALVQSYKASTEFIIFLNKRLFKRKHEIKNSFFFFLHWFNNRRKGLQQTLVPNHFMSLIRQFEIIILCWCSSLIVKAFQHFKNLFKYFSFFFYLRSSWKSFLKQM